MSDVESDYEQTINAENNSLAKEIGIWRGKGPYNGQSKVFLNDFNGEIPPLFNARIVSIRNTDITILPDMPMVENLILIKCLYIFEIKLSPKSNIINLTVYECDNLIKINVYKLNELFIDSCYKLDKVKVGSVYHLRIENSPATRISGFIRQLSLTNCSTVSLTQVTSTRIMHIANCPIKILHPETSLRDLSIFGCNEIISIPLCQLEKLRIEKCSNFLKINPSGKSSLISLIIINCPKLKPSFG